MKAILAVLLVLSVGVNVWLVATRGGGDATPAASGADSPAAADAAPRPAAGHEGRAARAGGASSATADAEVETLRERLDAVERELAAAKEKAAELDAMDPVARVLYSQRPLGWKARQILAIEPEKAQWAAVSKLSQALSEQEGAAGTLLDALKAEDDPKVLELLGRLVRGATAKASAEDRRAFAALMRDGASPELRAACVGAVFLPNAGRGGDGSKEMADEMNAVLVQVIRSDPSPEVVGAVAQAMSAWSPPPEAMDALKEAAARLPASKGRRTVWEAIARGTFMADSGTGLVQQFQAATAQDVKDDIAAGIGRAGNSMSMDRGGTAEERAKRVEEARARFRTVFAGTSDVAVRRTLARAALYGMGCVSPPLTTDEQKADAGRFLREIAALDPDAEQRTRLEKAAAAFETKGGAAYQDFDRILAGKD